MRNHERGEDNPDVDDFSEDDEESLEEVEDGHCGEIGGDREEADRDVDEGVTFLQEGEGDEDDEDSSEGEFDEPIAKISKKRKGAAKKGATDSVFAAYSSEYEDQMDNIMHKVRAGAPVEEPKKRRKTKK